MAGERRDVLDRIARGLEAVAVEVRRLREDGVAGEARVIAAIDERAQAIRADVGKVARRVRDIADDIEESGDKPEPPPRGDPTPTAAAGPVGPPPPTPTTGPVPKVEPEKLDDSALVGEVAKRLWPTYGKRIAQALLALIITALIAAAAWLQGRSGREDRDHRHDRRAPLVAPPSPAGPLGPQGPAP